MSALSRPSSKKQAAAIAEQGDAALPVLRSEPGLRSNAAAYSVRALGMIGTKKALDALKGYREDTRAAVIDELIHAGAAFDAARYSRAIAPRCPTSLRCLRRPTCGGCTSRSATAACSTSPRSPTGACG